MRSVIAFLAKQVIQLQCKSILFNRINARDNTKRPTIVLRYAFVEKMSRKCEASGDTPAVIAACGFCLQDGTSTDA